MSRSYTIVLDCPDRIGIASSVGALLTQYGGWVSEAAHHSDEDSNWFFSRIEVVADSLTVSLEELREAFTPLVEEFSLNLKIVDSAVPKKVVLMASKGSHCLADLLDRYKNGDLNCEISCVISNHDDMRSITQWYGIDYHHVPVDKDNKSASFAKVESLIEEYQAQCIVLARYMQILPQSLCEKLRYQVINIHHSFLPSFIGAKPYHQASRRGVKLIGATCHYVTEALDEGPIIDQDVVRVRHSDKVEDLVRLGKDVEKTVLARGLRAHLQDRVLVHGNKTVVFD